MFGNSIFLNTCIESTFFRTVVCSSWSHHLPTDLQKISKIDRTHGVKTLPHGDPQGSIFSRVKHQILKPVHFTSYLNRKVPTQWFESHRFAFMMGYNGTIFKILLKSMNCTSLKTLLFLVSSVFYLINHHFILNNINTTLKIFQLIISSLIITEIWQLLKPTR